MRTRESEVAECKKKEKKITNKAGKQVQKCILLDDERQSVHWIHMRTNIETQ